MGNYQWLLDQEGTRFEVIGFAQHLQGVGPQVRDLGPVESRQAYGEAADFLYESFESGSGVYAGDVILYDFRKDRWATLSFVVAGSVQIEPATDTM
jgi:hypothetical protein